MVEQELQLEMLMPNKWYRFLSGKNCAEVKLEQKGSAAVKKNYSISISTVVT